MKPLGQHPIRFPGKRNEWFGKGIRNWWEDIGFSNKAAEKEMAKREITEELEVLE